MQKRKPGAPHKGWKAAARKSRRGPPVRRKFVKGAKKFMGVVAEIEAVARERDAFLKDSVGGAVKGHSPWNDPDHDAWVPTDAAPFRPAEAEDFERPWDAIRDGLTTGPELIRAEAGELAPPGRSHSEVVSEMKAQRAAPKGPFAPLPIHQGGEDAAKMRERLTDCFTLLAKAIEKAAAVIAGSHHVAPELPQPVETSSWNQVGPGTPLGAWLETKHVFNALAESGTNVCMCRILSIGDEPEWIEKVGNRTTVTHSTFAAPTHWRWPVS